MWIFFFENLIFITNLWKKARNLTLLLKTHIGIWDYWRNNYVTIFYTDNAWKYELQSFLNNYFTHKKRLQIIFLVNIYIFMVEGLCRLISDRCEITVANQSILFFVDWLATVMLYNGRQSIYFIFCRLISDRYGP